MIPEKVRLLDISIGEAKAAGQLIKGANYEFRYISPDPEQTPVALLMPAAEKLTWQDAALFAPMDQNLPEGYLFARIRDLFPKQSLTPMHLLALVGQSGIGRLGYRLPAAPEIAPPRVLTQEELLRTRYSPEMFAELVVANLSSGAGISGVQPKIMVPGRVSIPIPSLIVKAGSPDYPHLAVNEYLCLSAARRAGIAVPSFALSDDGQMLIIERFDLVTHDDGHFERLGFEDVAALAGLRVRDIHSDRKYQGSYQRVAELLRQLQLHSGNIHAFFEHVAFSIMVRNGDAHLKNFGVLYRSPSEVWLAPMFDVVTTVIYKYTQYPGGPELEDRTLALKLFAGKHSNSYPSLQQLHDFGRRVCGVSRPDHVLAAIAGAMRDTLVEAKSDERVPKDFLATMGAAWEDGLVYGA